MTHFGLCFLVWTVLFVLIWFGITNCLGRTVVCVGGCVLWILMVLWMYNNLAWIISYEVCIWLPILLKMIELLEMIFQYCILVITNKSLNKIQKLTVFSFLSTSTLVVLFHCPLVKFPFLTSTRKAKRRNWIVSSINLDLIIDLWCLCVARELVERECFVV